VNDRVRRGSPLARVTASRRRLTSAGNLLVTVRAIALVGVGSSVQLGASYNSAAADQGASTRLGNGWELDPVSVRVKENVDKSLTYTGPSGLTGVFDLATGSTTTYVSPKGFKVTLTKNGSGWTLRDHASQSKQYFDTAGVLIERRDRDVNKTTLTQTTGANGFSDVSVLAPAGPTTARTVKVVTDAARTTTLTQTTNTASRSASFATVGVYANRTLTQFRDVLGRTTTFSYDGSALLTQVAAPGGVTTQFGYDSAQRVTSITQVETLGGRGSSVTRLAYPSSTQTLLADPNTDQAVAVNAVPHTTYDLNADQRVLKAVDAEGKTRSSTYTANFDPLTSSVGAAGAAQSNSSNEYGANGGDSLTKSTSADSAVFSATYASTTGPSQYSPTTTKDDAGKVSTYTYNGTGNLATSTDALSAKASMDYNPDGTIANAAGPKSSTNKTLYSYTNAQMTQVTPKTGSSLGVRNLTYDAYGRVRTTTNGRGITATNEYDDLGRLTNTSFSDGASVTYNYDTAGRVSTRADANGTTTYGYDQIGRLTSRTNTAGGGTFRYTYYRGGLLASSSSDAGGIITYGYYKNGKPSAISYPYSGSTATIRFSYDDHNRRTNTWMGANGDHTLWVARYQVDYNRSDKAIQVRSYQGTGDNSNTAVVDLTYCYKPKYNATTTVGVKVGESCTVSDGLPQLSRLQWKKNNLNGQTIGYDYSDDGRLKTATVSGGLPAFDYTYDKNGNRLTADNQTLTFNDENQITTSGYAYDAAGNLTKNTKLSQIGYTSADQLKSVVKDGTTYNYTHAGASNTELLAETTPQGTYTLAYGRNNAQGLPAIEQASKDGATASVINDPATGQPLMLRTSSGMQSMYVYDGTPGSPIALITSGAYVAFAYEYDPYGVPTLTQSSGGLGVDQNPFTFAGGVQDRTTGWVHYGNRYYDPTTGNWTQQDTLDAPLDPGNANRYAYAGGDPINNTDPSGRCTFTDCVGTGAAIGTLAGSALGAVVGGVSGSGVPAVGTALGALGGAITGGGTGAVVGAWAGAGVWAAQRIF